MRRSSPSPIPPSMYRHFAAITLALTMGLAMFANGENHEARATQIDQVEVEVAAQEEPARIVKAPKASAPAAASSQWYSEALDSAFGQPMDRPLGSSNSGFIPEEIEEMAAEQADQPSGPTQADRDMLLRQLRESHPPLATASAVS